MLVQVIPQFSRINLNTIVHKTHQSTRNFSATKTNNGKESNTTP